MKINRKGGNMEMIFTLLLFVVFVSSLFIVIIYSAGFYKKVGNSTEKLNNLSSASLFIAQKVRSYDSGDGITIGEKDGMNTLCFTETVGGIDYCTYIFCDNGKLCELYAEVSDKPEYSYGNVLLTLDRLIVRKLNDHLIEVITVCGDENEITEIYVNCGIKEVC